MTTPRVLAAQAFPRTSTQRVREFRRRNVRIEYYPSADAAAVIAQLRERNPQLTIGQVLDYLIERAMSQDK